jgi:hypothetical protein
MENKLFKRLTAWAKKKCNNGVQDDMGYGFGMAQYQVLKILSRYKNQRTRQTTAKYKTSP